MSKHLWSDDSGSSMVEYALLVALIALACISSIFPGIRNGIEGIFNNAKTAMDG